MNIPPLTNISDPRYASAMSGRVKLKPVHIMAIGLLLGFAVISVPAAHAQTSDTASPSAAHYQMRANSTRSVRSGVTAYRRGDFEKSAMFSRRALKQGLKKSRKSAAYGNLCAALAVQGQLTNALSACDDAIEADRKNWQAYANRAVLYSVQNQTELANSDVRKARLLAGEARVRTY